MATNCLQLRGQEGEIVATDGRQLLVQSGFRFPWRRDLLVPRSSIFRSDLPQGNPVRIGQTDGWLTLQAGPWTVHLALDKEGRFPKAENVIPGPEAAVARLEIAPADADFLAEALPRLPHDEWDDRGAVTLDLNGQVLVRARNVDGQAPTELVLSGSSASGESLRINTDRMYLARALQLGFRRSCLHGPESPALGQDEHRVYVWAILSPDGIIQPSPNTA